LKYDESDDYPDFIKIAAQKVSENPQNSKAVILGKSGQGEAMVANRFRGIRAAVFHGGTLEIIRLSREHNDSNVLSLGASFVPIENAKEALELWLETPFSGEERHARRIKKIDS
jgi:ribose 5-phosphate isomerase B